MWNKIIGVLCICVWTFTATATEDDPMSPETESIKAKQAPAATKQTEQAPTATKQTEPTKQAKQAPVATKQAKQAPAATKQIEQAPAPIKPKTQSLATKTVVQPADTVVVNDSPEIAILKEKLKRLIPEETPTRISPAAIPGLFEVVYGASVLYMTADGAYLITGGDIIATATRKNLTKPARNQARKDMITTIKTSDMMIFAAEKPRHEITVFTDIDCGYCRKMHAQVADYNKAGITIRYLYFPRAGVNSESYHKAVATWCADDKLDAMTRAKRGEAIERKTCVNPVKNHMKIGESIGVEGTPAIVLPNGGLLPGYLPPMRLAMYLEQAAKAATTVQP